MNELMNHFRTMGCAYKAAMYDFEASGDTGIALFLRSEAMERYDMAEDVADHIQQSGGRVALGASSAPEHVGATISALQKLVELEVATVKEIDKMIASAEPGPDSRFLQYVRSQSQYEHDEVAGIIGQITRIASDPGAMSQYNIFLEKKYGPEYHNPCGE